MSADFTRRFQDEAEAVQFAESWMVSITDANYRVFSSLGGMSRFDLRPNDREGVLEGGAWCLWLRSQLAAAALWFRDDQNYTVLVTWQDLDLCRWNPNSSMEPQPKTEREVLAELMRRNLKYQHTPIYDVLARLEALEELLHSCVDCLEIARGISRASTTLPFYGQATLDRAYGLLGRAPLAEY